MLSARGQVCIAEARREPGAERGFAVWELGQDEAKAPRKKYHLNLARKGGCDVVSRHRWRQSMFQAKGFHGQRSRVLVLGSGEGRLQGD